MREAYRAIRENGASGHEIGDLMRLYRDVQDAAGMDELYEIEARTTVRPDG